MVSIAVVIPVFNNARTLRKIICSIREYHDQIIVVNDGSTDESSEILQSIDGIQVVESEKNRGKGAALRDGFRLAAGSGFTHAITFDADGQYTAEVIQKFIDCVNEEPETIWTGTRSFQKQDSGDHSSSFSTGNLLIRCWYYMSTGLSIKDPMCGLRAYPLEFVNSLQYRTGDSFEFELEILLLAAWHHLPVKNIPIGVCQSKEGNNSQFRTVSDCIRIVRTMGILYLPLENGNKGFSWKGLLKHIRNLVRQELKANATPFKAAFSLSTGVFLAITPFHGLQVLMLILATFILKLNRPLAFLGVSISSAPFLPFWLAAGTATGKVVIPESIVPIVVNFCKFLPSSFSGAGLMHTFVYYFLGSIFLAAACGAVTLGLSFLLFRWRAGDVE